MVNRKNWLIEKINKHQKPVWNCPTCGLGTLEYRKNWATRKLSADTQKEYPAYLAHNKNKEISRFTGFLTCSNIQCEESVAVVGESSNMVIYNPIYDIPEEVRYYKPFYFYPSLCIFQIPNSCSTDIFSQIKRSFSHFFSDQSASANASTQLVTLEA